MKPRVYVLIFLLLLPVQASLVAPLGRINLRPDAGLAALLVIALLSGPVEGALAGIFIGLLQDIGAAGLIGFSSLFLGITGILAGFLARSVLDVRSPSMLLFLLLFSLGASILALLFLNATFGDVPFFSLLVRRMLPHAAATAVAGYALLRLLSRPAALAWTRRRQLQGEA